jgi:hypothetical protein
VLAAIKIEAVTPRPQSGGWHRGVTREELWHVSFALRHYPVWITRRKIRCTPTLGRDGVVLFLPRPRGRSEVATAGSEVSFIEQIGGARAWTLPGSERAVIFWSLPLAFQGRAAWRLNVISRPDKRREPLVSETLIPFCSRRSQTRTGCERRLSIRHQPPAAAFGGGSAGCGVRRPSHRSTRCDIASWMLNNAR